MFCSSLSSRRHLTNSNKTNRDNCTRVFLLYIFSLSDIKCSIIIQQVYMYFHQNYKRCTLWWRYAKTAKTKPFASQIEYFIIYSSIFFLVTWFNDIIHQTLNHTGKASWFPLLFQLVTIRISSVNCYSTSLRLSTNLVILQSGGEHSPANNEMKNYPSHLKLG